MIGFAKINHIQTLKSDRPYLWAFVLATDTIGGHTVFVRSYKELGWPRMFVVSEWETGMAICESFSIKEAIDKAKQLYKTTGDEKWQRIINEARAGHGVLNRARKASKESLT